MLSEKDIDKIAELAKLKPTAEEKKRLLTELNKILDYMEIIREAEVDELPEGNYPEKQAMLFREDEISSRTAQGSMLKNAPETRKGMFSVPRIIDKQKLSDI